MKNRKTCPLIRRIVWIPVSIAGLLAVFLAAAVHFRTASRASAGRTKLQAEIRGEPISSPSPPKAAEPANGEAQPRRKKYPKPSSFQKRIVEFQVNQLSDGKTGEAQSFGGTPAKTIFTSAQLAALPDPPLPPGYERISFGTLSGFPFEVTREMADGSKDPATASAATRSSIPASIQALDNHHAAIRGFLLPLKMNNGLAIEILLMRNQNMCCFGTVPKVNEWIAVNLPGEGTKPVMDQPVTILGRLRVGEIRESGYLVGIYRMEAEKISWPAENP